MRNETWSLARRYDPAVTPFLLVLAAMVLVAMLLGVHLFGQFAMNPAMAAVDAVTYIRVKRSFDLVVPRFAKPLMVAALVATAAALVAALSLEAHVAVACGVGLVALVVTLLAIVRGDLLTELPGVLDQAPRDARVVLIHTAVIAYLPAMARQRFVALVDELRSVRDLVWLSCEGATVLPGMADRLPPDRDPTDFVLARDGDPIALVHPHGRHHRRIDI